MQDLSQATVTETIYLRKWEDDQKDAGELPYEIIAIESVSEPDQEIHTVVRQVPPAQIPTVNERIERIERIHAQQHTVRALQQLKIEIAELESRVELWKSRSDDLGAEHKKLRVYRERLQDAYDALARMEKDG
jgi:predicted  nucleic acid-binding Zn-ribbon protein